MLFNSLDYLIFLPVVTTVYFLIHHRYRWFFLLIASYYFYMSWKVEYAVLILASTVSVYAAGIKIEGRKGNRKKWILVITLLFNLGILFVFKYYNFFNDTLQAVLHEFNIFYHAPELRLLLPVGISFYTFQVISYLTDVYKGEREAERHFGIFAVFVSFFPQLVAGPIERSRNLLPQFYEKHEFDYRRVTDGIKLIAWGLFKKMVIADRLAVYVDQIFNNPGNYTGEPVILGIIFFTFQIYCDFSGYSDIAIGSAQMLGIRLMKNFNRPYYAKSVSEFWRRWHISLSTWLEDYVYTPLLINRRNWGIMAVYFSLFVTFLVSGLWHGANWTFVIWGMLHGLILSLEVMTKKSRKRIRKHVPSWIYNNVSMVFTFMFVSFAHIFFRANTVSDAFLIIKNSVSLNFADIHFTIPAVDRFELLIALLSIAILETVHWTQDKVRIRQFIAARPFMLRWAVYIGFVSYMFIFRKTGAQFIYFQF